MGGLGAIATAHVCLDQGEVSRFSKRLDLNRGERDVDSLGGPARQQKLATQLLESSHPHLPGALPLNRKPVLVPSRQEFRPEIPDYLTLVKGWRAQLVRFEEIAVVDGDVWTEFNGVVPCFHRSWCLTANAPKGCAKVGLGAMLGGEGPELLCKTMPADGSVSDSEERDQSLDLQRDRRHSPMRMELEAAKELNVC